MSAIQNVSRRRFLHHSLSAGALVLGVQFIPRSLLAAAGYQSRADRAPFHPNVFVGIETDGTVYLIAHRSEMGTGSRTGLPRIIADEMDADWGRVRIEKAIGDRRYGSQNTDGSQSVTAFFDVMRQAGAAARLMLLRAAAQRWGVPATECGTELHVVVHKSSGRRLSYGELASAAAKLPVPAVGELTLKRRGAWRYIGKPASNYDLEKICTGKAVYGMDAVMEGMVYASIEHPPVLGGKVKSYDAKAPLSVRGVSQTITIDPFKPPHAFQPLGGVAVIAENTWAAFEGRRKLNVVWENGPNAEFDSTAFKQQLLQTARQPGKVVRNAGNVDAEFARASKVMEASYYTPLLAHASMEPPVAVADYRDGKVTAWAPTQDPQAVQATVAAAVGVRGEDVICHVTLLGGAFGRKSKPDYIAEAAVLSKRVGRPVKVVWTREDDIRFDYYHTVAAMYMKAAIGANGMPTAWLQRSVFPPIGSTFAVNTVYGDSGEMGMGWTDNPFDIPNLRAENGAAPAHVRIGWLRSVANIYHSVAVHSFAGELAHAADRDPLDYLLQLLGPNRVLDLKGVDYPNQDQPYAKYPIDIARLRHVTELAAEKAGWGRQKMGMGHGMGIAVHRSFLTYVATVVQVEVNGRGEVIIHNVHTAVDAGTVVNPLSVTTQFEGAAVFGASLALTGEITATRGVIDQSNFDSYPVASMKQAPRATHIYLVESTAPPAGVGEPGVPPFAPALCNAIFAATGKRVRELPLSRHPLV